MAFPPQELKYRLTLTLVELDKAADVYSDPEVPSTRRIEAGTKVTEQVIDSDSLTELKAGIADFRTNLREN